MAASQERRSILLLDFAECSAFSKVILLWICSQLAISLENNHVDGILY